MSDHGRYKPRVARPNGCGKRAYSSMQAARTDAKEIVGGPRMPGKRMRPYECPICPAGTWHLTSQRPR